MSQPAAGIDPDTAEPNRDTDGTSLWMFRKGQKMAHSSCENEKRKNEGETALQTAGSGEKKGKQMPQRVSCNPHR